MRQTLAILNDSVRLLRNRYIFWISLAVSVLIAFTLFGTISFNEQGWRILWFDTMENQIIRAGSAGARDFMSYMLNLFVFWWLSWGAIILAVLSTSGIMPEFLADGSIEVTLAKPISRVKLFGLKVLGALLFVALQVALAVGIAYVLMGIKVGIWLHAALWAIPLITLQFLYLYSVSALVAVLTRSTLASLLVTVLFYVTISGIQFAANQVDRNIGEATAHLELIDRRVEAVRAEADRQQRELTSSERRGISSIEAQGTLSRQMVQALGPWRRPLNSIELAVPKTGDIRKMVADLVEAPVFNEFMRLFGALSEPIAGAGMSQQDWDDAMSAGAQGQRAARQVNITRSLISSLCFTAAVLAAAAALFWRRDF